MTELLYIEVAGRKYVRLDHALKELDDATKDALEVAALLIGTYPALSRAIAKQAADDIRSLKDAVVGEITDA